MINDILGELIRKISTSLNSTFLTFSMKGKGFGVQTASHQTSDTSYVDTAVSMRPPPVGIAQIEPHSAHRVYFCLSASVHVGTPLRTPLIDGRVTSWRPSFSSGACTTVYFLALTSASIIVQHNRTHLVAGVPRSSPN